jgi:hypothetical protein
MQRASGSKCVGHVPHLQVPDVFNRELLKFLNQEEQN